MSERRLDIDIEPKSETPRGRDQSQQGEAQSWTRSDNSFKFNFMTDNTLVATSFLRITPPLAEPTRLAACPGQSSGFAFNFQIQAGAPEQMDTVTHPAPTAAPEHCPSGAHEPAPASIPSDSLTQSRSKKKKKSGKKKTTEGSKSQAPTSPSEGSPGDKDPELSAEQLLQREIDWCVEQLELGLNTQRGTPKQKDDASRAVRILRSCKAPLAKKRQVMRAMTGDYRRKMEEERERQLKIIQSAMTSLQVKTVSNSPRKSVFHRRAGAKTQVLKAGEQSTEESSAPASDQMQAEQKTSLFVLTPSKEEFKFNFV